MKRIAALKDNIIKSLPKIFLYLLGAYIVILLIAYYPTP